VDEAAELMVVPKEKFDELMASQPEVGGHIREKAKERAATNVAQTSS